MKKVVLSAAFVIVGTFAMAQQTMPAMKDRAQMEQKRAEKMKQMQQELNLTDAQVKQINDLRAQRNAEKMKTSTAQRDAKMQEMKDRRAEWKTDMQKILTPEQYQKWEKSMQENMQHRGKNMKAADVAPAKK